MSIRGPKGRPNHQHLAYGVDIDNDNHYPLPLGNSGTAINTTLSGTTVNISLSTPLEVFFSTPLAVTLSGTTTQCTLSGNVSDVRIVDGAKVAEIDPLNYIVTIDIEHHKIHEGDHYTASDWVDGINLSDTACWLIDTGAQSTVSYHFTFGIDPSGGVKATLFTGASVSANGSQVTFFNSLGDSLNTTGVTMYYNPTIVTTGTLRRIRQIGGGRRGELGAPGRTQNEFVTSQGKFLLCFQSQRASNTMSVDVEMYESSLLT